MLKVMTWCWYESVRGSGPSPVSQKIYNDIYQLCCLTSSTEAPTMARVMRTAFLDLFLAIPSSLPFLLRRLHDWVHINLAGFLRCWTMLLHLDVESRTGYINYVNKFLQERLENSPESWSHHSFYSVSDIVFITCPSLLIYLIPCPG